MTSKELFNEIHDFCLQNKDEANIKKYSRYFKGEYDAYGVDSKIMLEKIKELKNNKELLLKLLLKLHPCLLKAVSTKNLRLLYCLSMKEKKIIHPVLFFKLQNGMITDKKLGSC